MKLKSIRVKNFASYKDEILNFEDIESLSLILGPNGAGKSSFFIDATTTALFNRARCTNSQGTGLENLISFGENFLEVEIIFDSDSSEVKVIRRRFAKGGQELELYIDGVNHSDKIKETQAKLESIIKIDYDTFLDTVCIGQGESGRFMKKLPSERKEVFTQVLDLDRYDILQEFTKEIKKETKQKIDNLKEKLEELGNQNSTENDYIDKIKDGEQEISRVEFDIEIKESELEKEVKEKAKYEEIIKHKNEILSKQQNLKTKISSTEESISKGKQVIENLEQTIQVKDKVIDDLEQTERLLEGTQSEYTNLSAEKSSLETTNVMLSNQAKEIKTKYARLKDFNESNCEFCGQNITEEHKQKHLNDMMSEGKKYLSQINSNKEEIDNLTSQLSSINLKISTTRSQIQNLRAKKSEVEQAETKLSSCVNRLQELETNLVAYYKEFEEINKIEIEDIENKTFNDSLIKNQLSILRGQLAKWQSDIAVWKNELNKIEKSKDKIIKIEEELKELQQQFSDLDELVICFGKDGIQAIIIDNALPEIQNEINEFLGSLTDDRVSIEFITQKEKGKGKKASSIETLEILIIDETGARTYETYSGGERFRVDFSCHVGMSKFLARRAGSSFDFFIIDEGIGSQDASAKEQFVNAIHKLTIIFNKVLIITHIDDIIDSFPNKIEVYKDPIDGSKIRVL